MAVGAGWSAAAGQLGGESDRAGAHTWCGCSFREETEKRWVLLDNWVGRAIVWVIKGSGWCGCTSWVRPGLVLGVCWCVVAGQLGRECGRAGDNGFGRMVFAVAGGD